MRSSLRVVQLAARAGAPSRAIAGVVPPLRPAHRYAMLRGMATSSRGSYRHAPPPNLVSPRPSGEFVAQSDQDACFCPLAGLRDCAAAEGLHYRALGTLLQDAGARLPPAHPHRRPRGVRAQVRLGRTRIRTHY